MERVPAKWAAGPEYPLLHHSTTPLLRAAPAAAKRKPRRHSNDRQRGSIAGPSNERPRQSTRKKDTERLYWAPTRRAGWNVAAARLRRCAMRDAGCAIRDGV